MKVTQIRLSAVVGEDRRLVIDLPANSPLGPVELTIRPLAPAEDAASQQERNERESLRAKMRDAGFLSTVSFAHDAVQGLGDDERARAGTMPMGARPSEELVAEDRDRS
jgi:hypothetical protein